MSKFIIGDIHGVYKTFRALLDKLPITDYKDIVLVGDLVDRGPNSRDVVQFVIDNKIDCVLGNHEQMMIDYHGEDDKWGNWLTNGGDRTLMSYSNEDGVLDRGLVEKHLEYFKSLPLFLEYPEIKNDKGEHLVVSHSSIAPVWDWSKERREAQVENFKGTIIWDRDLEEPVEGVFNVWGHTPREAPKIRDGYVGIDTGCVFNRELYNKLSCLQFPEMVVFSQENIES